jgi:hypothetical protein
MVNWRSTMSADGLSTYALGTKMSRTAASYAAPKLEGAAVACISKRLV